MDTQIKLVVSDIDGVWTDGGLYYNEEGRQYKKFNVKDGAGVKLLKLAGIPVCFVTAKTSTMVEKRAREVGILEVHQGVEKKLAMVKKLLENRNLTFNEVAYIGDDFNDVPLLRTCKISAVPADATSIIKKEGKWQLTRSGGKGVFREFAEKLLEEEGILNNTFEKMIDDLSQ